MRSQDRRKASPRLSGVELRQLGRVHETQLVAFRITAIGTVIVGGIVRPQAGRAFVPGAQLQRLGPGCANPGLGPGGKTHLHAIAPGRRQTVERLLHKELRPVPLRYLPAGTGRTAVLVVGHAHQAKLGQYRLIESDHQRQITGTELDMTEHDKPSLSGVSNAEASPQSSLNASSSGMR